MTFDEAYALCIKFRSDLRRNSSLQGVPKESFPAFYTRVIALRIVDVLKRHSENQALACMDKFLAGLRYSEFFAENTSSEEYIRADKMASVYRQALGLSYNLLILELKDMGYH